MDFKDHFLIFDFDVAESAFPIVYCNAPLSGFKMCRVSKLNMLASLQLILSLSLHQKRLHFL